MSSSITMQSPEQRRIAEAVRQLEILGGKANAEKQYKHEGDTMVLAEKLTLRQGGAFYNRLADEAEMEDEFVREFKYKPWDVAHAAYNAMTKAFGATSVRGQMGFFGPTPPKMIEVEVGVGQTVQVPWGVFATPFLPGVTFSFDSTRDEEFGLIGVVFAEGLRSQAAAIRGVWDLIERELQSNSIYKGKAFTAEEKPRFVSTEIDEEKLVYAAETWANLEANLFADFLYRDGLEQMDLDGKRAILLHGEFGTGKTLAMTLTAKKAVQGGRTVVVVRPGRDDITDAFRTASMYAPAVILVEDVDTIADANGDVRQISHILELFDGMEAKQKDIMVVLTTNHIERLPGALKRPGRLDEIIKIGTPDEAGIRKLIEVNLPPDSLEEEIEWEAVGEAMAGLLPAYVVGAAKKAGRYGLARNKGNAAEVKLATEDLVFSALSMKEHLELVEEKPPVRESTLDQAVEAAVARVLAQKLVGQVLVDQQ